MAIEAQEVIAERYRLIRRAHEGRAGSVWEAEDLSWHGARVGLQFLDHPSLTDDKALAATLEGLERLVWPWFVHPNLSKIYHVGRHGSSAFVVSELVRGEPLIDRLQAGSIDETLALRILSAIEGAVLAAHHVGMRFGELSAGDVVLTPTGDVKVAYFGLPLGGPRRADALDRSVTFSMRALRADVADRVTSRNGDPFDASLDVHVEPALDAAEQGFVPESAPELDPQAHPPRPDPNPDPSEPDRRAHPPRPDPNPDTSEPDPTPHPSSPDSPVRVTSAPWFDPFSEAATGRTPDPAHRRILAIGIVGVLIVSALTVAFLVGKDDPQVSVPSSPVASAPRVASPSVGASPSVSAAPSARSTVPNVVGLSALEAQRVLAAQGITIARTIPTTGVPGLVARTNPVAGTPVAPATKVTLYVGAPPDRLGDG